MIFMYKKLKKYIYECTHPVIGEVWMLHRVTNIQSNTELQRQYEITPERLESLIMEYIGKGYKFLSIKELSERLSGNGKQRVKFVAVTLDDGYQDNYLEAYPIFKKYNVPFCIYLLQNEIVGDAVPHYPMLTKEQILDLNKEPLCTLGGHTYSHPYLGKLDKESQRKEIMRCKEWMEGLLQKRLIDYSYPFGSYNGDTMDIMCEIGIEHCTMAWGGEIRKGKEVNKLAIPRVLVTETTKKNG